MPISKPAPGRGELPGVAKTDFNGPAAGITAEGLRSRQIGLGARKTMRLPPGPAHKNQSSGPRQGGPTFRTAMLLT